MAYGDKRDFPKIDIYFKPPGEPPVYLASTTWVRTCREALEHYKRDTALDIKTFSYLKANFAKA